MQWISKNKLVTIDINANIKDSFLRQCLLMFSMASVYICVKGLRMHTFIKNEGLAAFDQKAIA